MSDVDMLEQYKSVMLKLIGASCSNVLGGDMRIIHICLMCLSILSMVMADQREVFTCGMSKAVGEGSESWNIGLNFEATVYGELSKYVSIGGKVGYNRFSLKKIPSVDGSLQFWELSPIAKVSFPIVSKIKCFLESSAGLYLTIGELKVDQYLLSDSEINFGLSFASGFDISIFEIKPGFKVVFTEGSASKWFTTSVGIQL